MRAPGQARGGLILLAILLVLVALLDASGMAVWETFAITLGIYVIVVVSLNLASGFTGVFSLGQIGFMALGAYISAILTLPAAAKAAYLPHLPGWLAEVSFDQVVGPLPVGWLLATLIAALLVAGIAALVGAVLMRLSGPFVSVATLGFLVIVQGVLINSDSFTRGARPFSNVTPYTNLWWVWGTAAAVTFAVWRIKRSSFGRAMFAQQGDRWAAQSVGISILRSRLLAFVVSAFFTAIAGSLYAHFILSFSPTAFDFGITFEVITMLVVGGMGSVSGSVIGAVLVLAVADGLRRVEDATLLYGMSGLLLAVFLIAVIIFRPAGIMGQREVSWPRLLRPSDRSSPER